MATVYRLLDVAAQFFDDNGDPYAGGLLFTYSAGSSTKKTTYQDSTGITAHANPIVLDSGGRLPAPVFGTTGAYKFVLAPSTDSDPPTSAEWTEDGISGINDTATTNIDQWVESGLTPTYVGATSFTFAGDQTTVFHVGRRIKTTNSGGTRYGRVTASSYSDPSTTITVLNDSGSLDAGLSAVSYGLLSATNSSVPAVPAAVGGGLEFLYSQTASASAQIDFTTALHPRMFGGEFDSYMIELVAVKPATDDVYLGVQIGTGGGPTYQSSGYEWGASLIGVSGVAADGSTTASIATRMVMGRTGTGNGIGNAAGEHIAGRLWIVNHDGSDYPAVRFDGVYIRADAVANGVSAFGKYGSALAVTALRFLMSSGNIASGTFRVYGVKTA